MGPIEENLFSVNKFIQNFNMVPQQNKEKACDYKINKLVF
jgi:hypothetical protein